MIQEFMSYLSSQKVISSGHSLPESTNLVHLRKLRINSRYPRMKAYFLTAKFFWESKVLKRS